MKTASTLSDQSLVKPIGRVAKKIKYRYRLVDYKNGRHRTDILLSQTKCNLEILPDGILVLGNFTANIHTIPVMKNEIESITLIRGKEVVDTFPLSPMHILSKLGVPNSISRYVSILPSEYRISETQIIIKCKEFQLSLITSGNRYESLLRSFIKEEYHKQLNLIEKPSINRLNYTADSSL
ncbi:hypothetical protein [Pricia sp.]|uniref:hypothetical protein n=1 Tax=Pricia sp. TaxID=2268138 RepID=UPI003593B09E